MIKRVVLCSFLSLPLFAASSANAMMPVAPWVSGSQGLIVDAKLAHGAKSASVRAAERACRHYRNRHQHNRCMHEHGM